MFHCKAINIVSLFLAISMMSIAGMAQTNTTKKTSKPSNNKATPQPTSAAPAATPAVSSPTSSVSPPAKSKAVRPSSRPPALSEYRSIEVSYFSWMEKLVLKSATQQEPSWASFNGTLIQYEKERYEGHWGRRYAYSLYLGQANAGRSIGQAIQYVYGNLWFWGVGGYYHFSYRTTAQSLMSIGPFILYRNVSWPLAQGVTGATSGSDVNGGLSLDMKFRINHSFEILQSIGAMAIDATTYWNVGVGYKF